MKSKKMPVRIAFHHFDAISLKNGGGVDRKNASVTDECQLNHNREIPVTADIILLISTAALE